MGKEQNPQNSQASTGNFLRGFERFLLGSFLTLLFPRQGMVFVGASCNASQLWWLHHCGLLCRELGNRVQKLPLCHRAPCLRWVQLCAGEQEKNKQKLYIQQKYSVNLAAFKSAQCLHQKKKKIPMYAAGYLDVLGMFV